MTASAIAGLTGGRLRGEEGQDVRVHVVHRLEDDARAAVLLEPVRHVADGDVDPERRELLLVRGDLRGEHGGREHAVEERLGAELDDARDELRLRVRGERGVERVALGLPERAALEAEPDECVHADARVPGGRDDAVVEGGLGDHLLCCLDAGAVEADVAAVELLADVREVLGELRLALACGCVRSGARRREGADSQAEIS